MTDDKAIEALRRAVETCSVGDCPDWAAGILASLSMDGFTVAPTAERDNLREVEELHAKYLREGLLPALENDDETG